MSLRKKLVIYTHFSPEMQSRKTCTAQERKVRDALGKMGIDHSEAVVIHDKRGSGIKRFRDALAEVVEMVERKEIGILAVDNQARFMPADETFAFITELVNSGGRFISTGDGTDTADSGWDLRVKLMALMYQTTIRNLRKRIRRS